MRPMTVAVVLIVTSCTAPAPSSPAASAAVSMPPASVAEISREDAIARAHAALREAGGVWDLVRADVGALNDVRPGWEETEWGRGLSGDLRVWRLGLRSGSLSAQVILDAVDGTVYGSIIGIPN
jgi:hypothetical protein